MILPQPYSKILQVFGLADQGLIWEYTAVCSAMRYIVDPPKSPLKRGTLIYCTLLQRKAL